VAQRVNSGGGEILTFTDADSLRALAVIADRHPSVVALDRLFAATARGAALIHRIKADPALSGSEIRVVSHDSGHSHVSPREPGAARPEEELDQSGTRRGQRIRVDEFVEVLIDGNLASVVDLSTNGAQVVSATVLKPNQRVRVSLSDQESAMRFNACVAWATFEIPQNGGPRYRAGIQFLDASADDVNAYSLRHRAP
jgi:archaeosine-15-forming tRNA-guanine transglycosylase